MNRLLGVKYIVGKDKLNFGYSMLSNKDNVYLYNYEYKELVNSYGEPKTNKKTINAAIPIPVPTKKRRRIILIRCLMVG